MGEEKEDAAPTSPEISFEPIVKLEAVKTKNLEEDEDVIVQLKAKLYRYVVDLEDGPQWKERGVGEVKILKHKESGKHRVLMRREKTLKLCANHQITQAMELKPHASSEKAFVWNTMADLSDGEAKQETLAIRFRAKEDATKFKENFDECVKLAVSPASTSKLNEDQKLPDLLSELSVKDDGSGKGSATKSSGSNENSDGTKKQNVNDTGNTQEKTKETDSDGTAAPCNSSQKSGET